MEKIYMEEDNKKKGKRSVVDASVILSFVVAIFAVFSLAMADISLFQKSGVSYAAPATLPNEFTFNLLHNGDKVSVANSTRPVPFNVPMYVADNDETNPIFCIEHPAEVNDGENYTSGDSITNYGLLYLLNNSYANGVNVTNTNNSYVEGWVTQTAIWMYLYETDPTATETTSKNYISPEDINDIKNATSLRRVNQSLNVSEVIYNGENLYTSYVKPLVDTAKNKSTSEEVVRLKVQKASDELSQSENKDFYFSSLITVTGDPSSSLKNYTVSLNGIDGAKAVDENGAELPQVVNPGTKFYVRIPAEKVTTEVQKVIVSVRGMFDTLEGKYYNAATSGLQKVVSVNAKEKPIDGGTEVEFIGTENTGMSTVQTIYFIGLIVLLCGVGIVYANAKPVQVKQ